MARTVKKALSIPVETYRKVEALRRKTGIARSQFVAEAIEAYLSRQQTLELEVRDEAGYRKLPEDAKAAEAWLAASLPSWGPREDW